MHTVELELLDEPPHGEPQLKEQISTIPTRPLESHKKSWRRSLFWQLFRFGLVGGLNTGIDLLFFNGLLWLWPTRNTAN